MQINLINNHNDTYDIQLDKGNYIKFCPSRGGIITNWVSNRKEILYFDQKRFLDKTKSIRGGIPILFPICGDLEDISLFGESYLDLMQHGFARDLAWTYKFNKFEKSLCLSLSDNEFTRRYYPFCFELNIEYILEVDRLSFIIYIHNKSQYSMPINFGLHPYFNISNFHNLEFIDYAKTSLNQKNNKLAKTENLLKNLSKGIDLLMYSSGKTSFIDYGLQRQITLINPSPFDISVLWSDPPRQMVCMEPWTSPRNSLGSGWRKINISSNSYQKLYASILVENL